MPNRAPRIDERAKQLRAFAEDVAGEFMEAVLAGDFRRASGLYAQMRDVAELAVVLEFWSHAATRS